MSDAVLIEPQDPALGLATGADEDAWEELVADVVAGDCALFLGSGPSAPLYGTWDDVVECLASAANIPVPAELPSEQYLDFLEQCRSSLGEADYVEALAQLFDPNRTDQYRSIHRDMLCSNFCTFVTTNFDNCLEEADDERRLLEHDKIQVYPGDVRVKWLGRRTVTHLHGRAYDHRNGRCLLPQVLLTRRDFDSACQDRRFRDIWLHLLDEQSVVFVGYSFQDGILLRILKEDFVSVRAGLPSTLPREARSRPLRCYVMTPAKLWTKASNVRPSKVHAQTFRSRVPVSGLDPAEAESQRRSVQQLFTADECSLVEQVQPIIYACDEEDGRHARLNSLFRDLRRRAPYKPPGWQVPWHALSA